MLFCNDKGYVSQEELFNETFNWRDILDFIENQLYPIGITIKKFNYKGQINFTVIGPNEYNVSLSDNEAFLLLDFIIRFNLLNPNEKGLHKTKWKEIILLRIGKKTRSFTNALKGLKMKGFLEAKSDYIRPGWRYYSLLNINEIIEEIKTDAKLSYLTQKDTEERGIFD